MQFGLLNKKHAIQILCVKVCDKSIIIIIFSITIIIYYVILYLLYFIFCIQLLRRFQSPASGLQTSSFPNLSSLLTWGIPLTGKTPIRQSNCVLSSLTKKAVHTLLWVIKVSATPVKTHQRFITRGAQHFVKLTAWKALGSLTLSMLILLVSPRYEILNC